MSLTMKKCVGVIILLQLLAWGVRAQTLSLDSCIAMAIRENTQLQIAKLKAEQATDTRKSARSKYLPHIEAVGTYMRTGKEVSLLSDEQKEKISNMGTTIAQTLTSQLQAAMSTPEGQMQVAQMAQLLGIPQQSLPTLIQASQQPINNIAQALNQEGSNIVDALRTDTRNAFAAAVTLTQPIYMGGKVVNGNKMADIAEAIANIQLDQAADDVKYNVENTYYLVVGVEHKKQLADEYAALIQKLSNDVEKMIAEGVATKADGLKVSVKLNEAQMQQLQAENGLALSKMLLCKLCGLPLDSKITVDTTVISNIRETEKSNNRAELKMLGQAVELYNAKVKMERAEHLPQVALTGGYMLSNPNCFNGFEKTFKGTWNVGVVARIPIWDWNETHNKVKVAKKQAAIAQLQLTDAQQLIDLQISQTQFKYDEAVKKLSVTQKNYDTAEENLRCANMGFEEGVMTTTDVMMAQTAWLQAKTQKIEAEIEVITAQLALSHAYGN